MRIVGIDPGLATVGIGLISATSSHDIQVEDWLTIRTKPGLLPGRLEEIHHDLRGYLESKKPDLAVVERLFFAKNETTALDVAHARGCILMTLSQLSIPLLEPSPPQLKACITGDGRASKVQVQDMLVRMLHLDRIPEPDDALQRELLVLTPA